MAILDENTNIMSGSEFREAINKNALDLKKTEEQTISGDLRINGKLSLNQALIINDTIETPKNIIIQANNISTNINNKKITFTDTNYNSEIGNIFSNGFGMKINENFTINNTSSNVSTTAQLNGGNLFIRMNVENKSRLGEKVIGFGNTSDPWVLETNGLVLTSVTYPDNTLQGDISTYSSLYLNPPKKSTWSSTHNNYNNLEKTLMLARRGIGTTTGDIDSENKNYYIWGDHNPYFHPASTGKSSGGIWIEYDNSSAGYSLDIGVKGHQGVLTDIGNQDANAICLRSINKGQDYYTGNANYSTLYVLSPINAKDINIPLQNRLKFQSGSDKMYMIYGDHNPNIQSPSGNLKFWYNGNTPYYNKDIGEKGIQMIGTDMTNNVVNDLYLKSVNKGVTEEMGFNSINSTTLFIQSPKKTDNTDVQLKDRLLLQSGTDTLYKIYGEHNMKVVFYNAVDSESKIVKFTDIGVNFVPSMIECENIGKNSYECKTVAIYDSGKETYVLHNFYNAAIKACTVENLTLVSTGKHLIKFYA